MNIIQLLSKLVTAASTALDLPPASVKTAVKIEQIENIALGDYTTNIALILAKQSKQKPIDLAKTIVAKTVELLAQPDWTEARGLIQKVEVAGAGFINFTLAPSFFQAKLADVLGEENLGVNTLFQDQQVIIEYTNTNVLKPLHIGHLMGNILGESLCRIFEKSSAKVIRCTYEGDVGLHIAKTLWGIEHCAEIGEKMPAVTDEISQKMSFVGKCYTYGSNQYEDSPESAEAIKIINQQVYGHNLGHLESIYQTAREWSLQHFEEIYQILGTRFDHYFFESEVAKQAVQIVTENVGEGKVFERSDGAIIFNGENQIGLDGKKLHTRVFLNSQGLPTYEAKDIAHAIQKYLEFPANKSIIITANEQDEYFRVVLKVLQAIAPNISATTEHLSHGLLRLTEGKMSSRKGNVITGEDLIMETKQQILVLMQERDFTELERAKIAEQVAVGAIKFTVLVQKPGSNIVFDREKAISFEGDSGPYLQYTCVRARSVLKKAEELSWLKNGYDFQTRDEIYPVVKKLAVFETVIERCAEEKTAHYLVRYLLELSAEFNSFYAQYKIIDETKQEDSKYHLAICSAITKTLENGLKLLGIKIPEKM